MRCSTVFRSSGAPLYGTATIGNGYLFLPVPIHAWGGNAINERWASPDMQKFIDEITEGGIRVRLYDPKELPEDRAFFFSRMKYSGSLIENLRNFGFRVLDTPGNTLVFICVHGKRDACCALFGQNSFVEASKKYNGKDGVEIFRCSHLGGDRFAGTGIVFPSGNMYGKFEGSDIIDIIKSELNFRIHHEKFRGCVFEDKSSQIVRYAAASLLGQCEHRLHIEVTQDITVSPNGEITIIATIKEKIFVIRLINLDFEIAPDCRTLIKSGTSIQKSLVVRCIEEKMTR